MRAALLVLLVLAGCPQTEAPAPRPAERDAASAADQRSLLSDDKLDRFVVYQREMLPAANLVAGPLREQLMRNTAAIEKAALEKSGLTAGEAAQLTALTSRYLAEHTTATGLRKRLEHAKQRSERAKPGGLQNKAVEAQIGAATEELGRFDKQVEELTRQYGPRAVEALDRHEAELLDLKDRQLGAAASGGQRR